MMALSGRVVLYWPEKVLAIYFPAVRGDLGRQKYQAVNAVVKMKIRP